MELPGPLVDAAWLADNLGSPGLVVADVRWSPDGSGRTGYESGHVAGAVFVDVDSDLAAPAGPRGRHPLPEPAEFARSMGALGIGNADIVVAYDAASGSTAARLWWMLSVIEHPAAVLDGGLAAWDEPLSSDPVRLIPAVFSPRPWPGERLAHLEEAARGDVVLLDARAAQRYRGEVEPVDRLPGHVPGARNAPWQENVDDAGRFRPADALRARYEALGTAGRDVVVSCGSGVTACHDALAMELAGLSRPRLWVGSYSEWCADPSRPIATGTGRGVSGR